MVLHPTVTRLMEREDIDDTGLTVGEADATQLPILVNAATSAFAHERLHLDPRLSSDRAGARCKFNVVECCEVNRVRNTNE